MTSDRVEVLKWDPDSEGYELEFTFYPDGSVDGEGHHASELRYVIEQLEKRGETPEDWFVDLAARMVTNWENALYVVDVYSDG